MPATALKSKRIITPEAIIDGVVIIKNNKIADVLEILPEGEFDLQDLGDLVLMPGIIDPHVHINEPGRAEWEGFDTATRAAVAGGVTTMIEMPLNASPVTTSVKAFEEKIKSASELHCNCGFWGGIIPGNEKEIEPLIQKGIFGFKAFLTHSGIDEFPNVSEQDLRKAMPLIAKHQLPLLVHCELETPVIQTGSDPHVYENYLASRPAKWENDAIALMIRLCGEFNCRVHIVHLSAASSIGQIRTAKQNGLPLTVETGQHYLYFNAEQIGDGKTEFKCAPPIREKENNEQLWEALKDGTIDFVATDHSPAPPLMKEVESGDFRKAWGGISSIQYALPALWTAAEKHKTGIDKMAKWLCENPSKLAGLEHRKGRIKKGFDADLQVWNPEKKFRVESTNIHHRHKMTPYLNEELAGVTNQTWLAGKKIYDDGKFLLLRQGEILLKS